MPEKISQIGYAAVRKMAEDEREKQNPGSKEDNILKAIVPGVKGNTEHFWFLVFTNNPLWLTHPMCPNKLQTNIK